MPIESLIIVAFALVLFSCFGYILLESTNDRFNSFLLLSIIVIDLSIVTFFITDIYTREVSVQENKLTVHSLENRDLIIDDNNIVNLNEKLQRDFEDGDEVTKVTTIYDGMLLYNKYVEYKAK